MAQEMGILFTLQTRSRAQHQGIFNNKGSGFIPLRRKPAASAVSVYALLQYKESPQVYKSQHSLCHVIQQNLEMCWNVALQ